jgi:GT2 family glycosyltransferase
MKAARIAVVVVSLERAETTRRCLQSVRRYAVRDYHIFLSDNGSRSECAQSLLRRCESESDVTVARLPANLGPSAGRNRGLKLIDDTFTHIALLDNDIVALPGWDARAFEVLESEFDLIQPKLLQADLKRVERGPNIERVGTLAANPEYLGVGASPDAPEVNESGPCAIVGTAAVMRRAVVRRVGLFDESLAIGEDFDYSFRARKLGFKLGYAPRCVLVHDHQFDYEYDSVRSRVDKYVTAHFVLWRKHGKALLSPAYLSWYSWLAFHREPMYLPPGNPLSSIPNRLRRRVVRWLCMRFRANHWKDRETLDLATRALGKRLERHELQVG